MEKEKKRIAKKEKIAADKSELRKKMSVIATTTLDNDEDLLMSRRLWDEVQKKGFDGVGEKSDEESDDGSAESDEESKGGDDSDAISQDGEDESNSDSEEIDEKVARV